ncbi:MAG: DUF4263 domain-containing protein [Spirochaetaceae bacterium]|nr:DUF4263 domain-containing protein [Spirochaetaceae bacterium]
MIKFSTESNLLLFEYSPETSPNSWIFKSLKTNGHVNFKKIFFFTKEDLYQYDDEYDINDDGSPVIFVLGNLNVKNDYFMIEGKKLGINQNIGFEKQIELKTKYFIAARNISIFKRLDSIIKNDVLIGNDVNATLQYKTFQKILQKFPNTTECNKYAEMRISMIIREELSEATTTIEKYEKYMNDKPSRRNHVSKEEISEIETIKYEYIFNKLNEMISHPEEYSEKIWQNEMLDILQLLFPKYVSVLKEVTIKDIYSDKSRRLDYLLIDFKGNIDIIEIKRPRLDSLITKTAYSRDNFVPLRDLSEAVMQVEKYIFYLNSWSRAGEDALQKKYQSELPENLKIKIINPSGIIIMGLDKDLSKEQLDDLEIIKRTYNKILDIITYDDLIRRLESLIYKFKSKSVDKTE